nr:hypothetical protein StreXyl84_63110 [Streptomyces sp. Xyl84]
MGVRARPERLRERLVREDLREPVPHPHRQTALRERRLGHPRGLRRNLRQLPAASTTASPPRPHDRTTPARTVVGGGMCVAALAGPGLLTRFLHQLPSGYALLCGRAELTLAA